MRGIFLFFIGYVTALVPTDGIEELTALLFESKIAARLGKRRRNVKKGRKIRLSESAYGELLPMLDSHGITLTNVRFHGIPHIYRRYGKRYGLAVGAVLTLALLFASSRYVWRIEVSGNERAPDEEIIAELAEVGFGVGTCIGSVDFDVLHNRFSAASRDIAWISVNMHGNVAYVEVREYLPSELPKKDGAANVVAAKDGRVTLVSVIDGSREVMIGQDVKKGQLLISGVMEFEGRETEYVYASGEVLAETERAFSVSIPLVREKKTKTSEKTARYGVKIFSHTIFFGGKGRIEDPECDTITMYKDLTVFGGAPLPVSVIIESVPVYETVTEELSPERAAALAYAEYKRAFAEKTDGVTLLGYETESKMNGDGTAYVIDCRLRVIENIAETKEFTVNE